MYYFQEDLSFLRTHYGHLFEFREYSSARTDINYLGSRVAYAYNDGSIGWCINGFDNIMYENGYRRHLSGEELSECLKTYTPNLPWLDEWIERNSKIYTKDKDFKSFVARTTKTRGRVRKDDITGKWTRTNQLYQFTLWDTFETINTTEANRQEHFQEYRYKYYSKDYPFYTIDGQHLPLHVVLDSYDYCEEHNNYFHINNGCRYCNEQYKIYNYTYNVAEHLQWKKDKNDSLFMGIELEYETPQSYRKQVYDQLKGHVLLKQDGSLSRGFEIVSTPASMAIHLEEFKKFKFNEQTVERSCGMHVHVDKSKLTALQVGKLIAFIYNPDNRDFINNIAGRQTDGHAYANTATYKTYTTGYRSRVGHYDKGIHAVYNDHSTALNISGKNTIEFRIFKSPSTYDDFKVKLEFVRALVSYCASAAVAAPLNTLKSASTFISWLKTERKSYPSLHSFVTL